MKRSLKKIGLLTIALITTLLLASGCACYDPWFTHGHSGGHGYGHGSHSGHHGHHRPHCD